MNCGLPSSQYTVVTRTFTSLKYTSAVGLQRMPIFFSGLPDVTPPKERSTMKAVICSSIYQCCWNGEAIY